MKAVVSDCMLPADTVMIPPGSFCRSPCSNDVEEYQNLSFALGNRYFVEEANW